MAKHEAHKYADIFPMIAQEEFTKLKDDITKNGLLQPVVLYEGKILDGRNRYKACAELGISPKFEEYKGDSPLQWVISLNLHRRHLSPSQSAAIAVDSTELIAELESEAKARQVLAGGDKKSKEYKESVGQKVVRAVKEDETRTAKLLAQTFNTNKQYINDAKKLKAEKPEIYEKVKAGETTISEVKRELKREAREQKLEQQKKEIEAGNIAQPESKYDVIAIDPPWSYGNKYDPDNAFGRAAIPYPDMSLEEIKAIKLPDKNDCVLWLWITNAYIPKIAEILNAWGYEYKNIITWDKVNIGVGHWLRNKTEHCVLAIKGKPYFNNTKWSTLITEKRGEHSAKPEIFYQMVDEICAGKKLEYFSRTKRDGWDVFGDEV